MPSDQQINPEQVKPVQDRSHRGATRPKRDITLFQRQRQLQMLAFVSQFLRWLLPHMIPYTGHILDLSDSRRSWHVLYLLGGYNSDS